jgi:hypothetical protein
MAAKIRRDTKETMKKSQPESGSSSVADTIPRFHMPVNVGFGDNISIGVQQSRRQYKSARTILSVVNLLLHPSR